MRLLFLLFALALGSAAHAGGVERLKAFAAGAKTAEADFTQTVSDKNGRGWPSPAPANSAGTTPSPTNR